MNAPRVKDLPIGVDLRATLGKNIDVFIRFIDTYIGFFNKFIGFLRRQQCLRFERSNLIKYTKKMRFIANSLASFKIKLEENNLHNVNNINQTISLVGSQYLKYMEILDLLCYYLTQPLKNEIMSKLLNQNYILKQECINIFEDTNNHMLKFVQWFMESLNIDSAFYKDEVIQFSKKWAEEDGVDLESTANIFLQDIIEIEDENEYNELLLQWTDILEVKIAVLESNFDFAANDIGANVMTKKR